MPEYTFKKADRIKKPADFRRAFKNGISCRGDTFSATVCGPGADGWRLGLSIPSRYAGSAVSRNRIKRIAREAFRTTPGRRRGKGADIIIRLRRKIPGRISYKNVKSEIDSLLRKAGLSA